jgi:chromate transporter
MPPNDQQPPGPQSLTDLFLTFNRMSLQGFGGVLAIVQRELVERKQWLTREQFVETLSVSQVLPGPNVVNMALMIGDRHFGLRGAFVALAGMLLVPLIIVLALAVLYVEFASLPAVSGALRGMGAVAAGLVIATGVKLLPTLKKGALGLPLGLTFAGLMFVATAGPHVRRADVRRDGAVALAARVGAARVGRPGGGARVEAPVNPALTAAELWALFGQFFLLSFLSVGGAIAVTPEMHRYLVTQHGWMTDAQFTASVAIAQAAPGPNVLFVAVMGWNVAGPLGALATMCGILIPSTVLSLWATRWGHSRRETRGVRAFTSGMAPLTIGLLLATGWLLAGPAAGHVGAMLLVAATVVVMMRTKISPLWVIAAGAVVGASGFA